MLLKLLLLVYIEIVSASIDRGMDEHPTKRPKFFKHSWSTPRSYRSATAGDFFGYLHYSYDDDEEPNRRFRGQAMPNIEFEPVVHPVRHKTVTPGINCDEFQKYATNCTSSSAELYNSTKKSPPMPAKMQNWCSAIRYLTNCAIDWNSECKDVTESHFNEESIKGHMHVVNHICDDDWFLSHYDDLPSCIDQASEAWEKCYVEFKVVVDAEKNTTHEWTHYLTHFNLCCARAKFRHCTLKALFLESSTKCSQEHAVTLQKFSVIISEGDVYQECDANMLYSNCPGGDPRPPNDILTKAMNIEPHAYPRSVENILSHKLNSGRYNVAINPVLMIVMSLVKLCM